MQAVIRSGGKQYVVAEGDVLRVEKLPADEGESIEIKDVLSVGEGEDIKVGTPLVEGATVKAKVLEHGRHKKIVVFKKKRRKGYERKQGHRQWYTSIKIEEIKA